ncbi:MAG: hypothetical protein M3137_05320 [Actinomycetota bacterium]|nr:hypothetical protein [Actinomycetota bacterium]
MTLTEIIESWVADAERMHGAPACGVVVTEQLFAHLAREQAQEVPTVAGHTAHVETPVPAEAVEVAGPDRVCVYVGVPPDQSASPVGHDPAMPVVFVPVPPETLDDSEQLEMYNRLRWIGLPPEEALAGSR